jgi:hypothetical protein
MMLAGSGVGVGGVPPVVTKLELQGVTKPRLPLESSVNAMKMVPAGSLLGKVTVWGLAVQVPMGRSETLKLIASMPVAPDSWLIALESVG